MLGNEYFISFIRIFRQNERGHGKRYIRRRRKRNRGERAGKLGGDRGHAQLAVHETAPIRDWGLGRTTGCAAHENRGGIDRFGRSTWPRSTKQLGECPTIYTERGAQRLVVVLHHVDLKAHGVFNGYRRQWPREKSHTSENQASYCT